MRTLTIIAIIAAIAAVGFMTLGKATQTMNTAATQSAQWEAL